MEIRNFTLKKKKVLSVIEDSQNILPSINVTAFSYTLKFCIFLELFSMFFISAFFFFLLIFTAYGFELDFNA